MLSNKFLIKKLRVCSIDNQFDTLTFGAAVFKDPAKILQKMFVLSAGAVFADMKKPPNVVESTRPAAWFNPYEFHTLGMWITAYLETRLRLFYFGLDRDLLELPDPRRQREVFAAQWASLGEDAQRDMIEGVIASAETEPQSRIGEVMAQLRASRRMGEGKERLAVARVIVFEAYRQKDPRKFAYYMLTCPFKDCTKPDFFVMNKIILPLREASLAALPDIVCPKGKRRKGKKAAQVEHPFCFPEAALKLLTRSLDKDEGGGSEGETGDAQGGGRTQQPAVEHRESKRLPLGQPVVLTFLFACVDVEHILSSTTCRSANSKEHVAKSVPHRRHSKPPSPNHETASMLPAQSPEQSSNYATRSNSVAHSFLETLPLPSSEAKHLPVLAKKDRKFKKGKPPKPKRAPNIGVKLSSLHRGAPSPPTPAPVERKKQRTLQERSVAFSVKDEVESRHRPCSSVSTIDVPAPEEQLLVRKKGKPRKRANDVPGKEPPGNARAPNRAATTKEMNLTRGNLSVVDVQKRVGDLFEERLSAQIEQSVERLIELSQALDAAREMIKARITLIVLRTFREEVELVEFGSYITRLTTPLSDIDLGLRHRRLHLFSHAVVAEMLECLSENLAGVAFITNVTTILTASVPVIKIEADPSIAFEDLPVGPRPQPIKCDVIVLAEEGFGVEHSSIRTTWYICDAITRYPTFHKNILLLKYCLNCLDATNAYKGGLNSYGLSLIYIAFLRSEGLQDNRHLGSVLLRFLSFIASFDADRNAIFLNNPSKPVIAKEFYMGPELSQLLVMDPTSLVPKNVTASCLLFSVIADFFRAASREFERIRVELLDEFGKTDVTHHEIRGFEEKVRQRAAEKLIIKGETSLPLLQVLFSLKL